MQRSGRIAAGICGRDHLVRGIHAERTQRQFQGVGPVGDRDDVPDTQVAGEGFAEFRRGSAG